MKIIFILFYFSAISACVAAKDLRPNIGMSVKEFGAVGDAKKDDTAAIQKALDFAFENKEGNPVVLPAGGYVISKPLIVPRNVDIIGEGFGFSSSIIPINCDAIWLKGETQEGGYEFRNKIQSLNINMKRAASGRAIVVDRAYNVKLSEIFVYEAPEIGIYVNSSNHISFESVIVYGAGNKNGIGIKIKDSIVNMYNIDIENIAIALEIGPDKQNTTHVSVFGGFIERFGKHAINIIGNTHNTFIGVNIQADNEEKIPVSINGNANVNQASINKNNTFIGGYIGYAKAVNKTKKNAKEYKLNTKSHVINVGE
ncbi:MAG: glycosyl hydrolase family 28-related protein [Pseudomonadota bacterium]